jgi:hypothetical protein
VHLLRCKCIYSKLTTLEKGIIQEAFIAAKEGFLVATSAFLARVYIDYLLAVLCLSKLDNLIN